MVVLVAGLAYLYMTSTGSIASLNSSISSQQGVITSEQGVVSSQQSIMADQSSTIQGQSSSISVLKNSVSAQEGSISTLQANVSAYRQLVATLHQAIAADTAQISTLNGKLSADNASIASLNTQVATAQALIKNLTTTINLQASKVMVSGQSVTIYGTSSTPVPFLSFSPTHAGYVLITVSAASESFFTKAQYEPTNSNSGGAIFIGVTGLSSTSPLVSYYIIPVVPGTGNLFALIGNSASDGTATVSATYFY